MECRSTGHGTIFHHGKSENLHADVHRNALARRPIREASPAEVQGSPVAQQEHEQTRRFPDGKRYLFPFGLTRGSARAKLVNPGSHDSRGGNEDALSSPYQSSIVSELAGPGT